MYVQRYLNATTDCHLEKGRVEEKGNCVQKSCFYHKIHTYDTLRPCSNILHTYN